MLEVIDRFETTRMRSMFECFDNINSCFSLLSTLKLGLSGEKRQLQPELLRYVH
jgi:hypothetical protein